MDFNFSSFSPRSFEHIVQALCVKILGPGTRVYGDGPDGGREASFEGKVPYPSETDCWNGYIVVQAKFQQKERGEEGSSWLIDQLDKEIQKFSDTDRRLRVPDYYILATNVKLSSVLSGRVPKARTAQGKGRKAPQGGQQKLDTVMAAAKGVLWSRGYAIWHADTLATFLRGQDSIRRTYACWLSSSDVLGEMMAALKERRADFEETMSLFLARELWNDRWANLDHTGHEGDDQTLLANVFIDLPYEARSSNTPEDGSPATLAAYMIELLRDKLDPQALARVRSDSSGPEPSRYVVLGGPGQGKSTLGQFLAQLYRAALLKDRRGGLEVEKARGLDCFLEQCRTAEITLPEARRFPIRIELPRFADLIRPGDAVSLLEYIASHIGKVADANLDLEDLRRWLAHYPWVLILDGMDEVPPSGNRTSVLAAINRFWDEVAARSADLAMIVTSRPQGFNNDLPYDYYNHIYLSKLLPDRALFYAERLLQYRERKPPAREVALERLRSAAEKSATARLMTTPLQVTIMAALVQGKGELPQDRWNLFRGYFEVIRDREASKPEAVSRMLKEFGSDIEAIHYLSGLIMQVESEREGGADASMSIVRLRAMMAQRLKDSGYREDEASSLSKRIVTDAMTRLVLLAGEREGRVSFEVRSLQEFMAASALMTGNEIKKVARLRHIAGRGHWRHVFLFAAGRCFSDVDVEHLQDSVYGILGDLDDFDDNDYLRAAHAGGRLALELLEDANALHAPMAYRHLWKRASGLLSIDGAGFADRLASVYQPWCEPEAHKAIETVLPSNSGFEGWRLLFALNERSVPWAVKAILKYLPGAGMHPLSLIADVLPANAQAENIIDIFRFAAAADSAERFIAERSDRISKIIKVVFKARTPARGGDLEYAGIKFCDGAKLGFRPVDIDADDYYLAWALFPDNRLSAGVLAFKKEPNKLTLSKLVSGMAVRWPSEEGFFERNKYCSSLPWIINTISSCCDSGGDLHAAATSIRDGGYGDIEDWRAAERRWKSSGLTMADIEVMAGERGLGRNIAADGVFLPQSFQKSSGKTYSSMRYCLDSLVATKNIYTFGELLNGLLFIAGGESDLAYGVLIRAAQNAEAIFRSHAHCHVIESIAESAWETEEMGTLCQAAVDVNFPTFVWDHDRVRRHYRAFPGRIALLVFLAGAAPSAEDAELIEIAAPFVADLDRPAAAYAAFSLLCARHGALAQIASDRLSATLRMFPQPWTELLAEAMNKAIAEDKGTAGRIALDLARAGVNGFHSVLSTMADQTRAEFLQPESWKNLGLPASFHHFTAPE